MKVSEKAKAKARAFVELAKDGVVTVTGEGVRFPDGYMAAYMLGWCEYPVRSGESLSAKLTKKAPVSPRDLPPQPGDDEVLPGGVTMGQIFGREPEPVEVW